ncbi:response regulator [Eubacterium sp. 1001713B170207_170306_E7]|uniref:response regulator n=1 Tax=Eubacterium sp. 1001713B170207_170306_E7 TaxID=2787097 RepID=UPI00189BB482|nr:response regulator [Eubacterium sp. 1001713B170207_170306_E7]
MNIIAVDDEALALGYMLKILKEAVPGSHLKGFDDPFAALDYLKDHPADIAFLDIEMYGLNGIELAKRFKEAAPAVKIIFATGFPDYALDAFSVHASGYLLKPPTVDAVKAEIDNLALPPADSSKRVRIQTFGNFEVFVDGAPLRFGRTKSKELFAYLIDRKGSGSTTAELISVLWEDRDLSHSLQSQFQTVAADMTKTFKAVNAEEILIKKRNYLSVDPEKLDCDYYNFLKGDTHAINSYAGEYMSNYSWAEFTTGFLSQKAGIL